MTPRARRILRQSIAFVSSTITLGTALSQVRAFPEAEGFGAYTTGARTNLAAATVYHVTNLNDSGAGSFRDAVSASNRFVVFDVSGVANLLTPVSVKNNVTIAGQTAPGGGFTLYGAKVSYTGADNSITRYLRVRKGHTTGRDDAVSLADGQNMIFDHMSVTWGNDETFSMNPSTGATIDNITIQNTIIGQGLDNVNHSAGGLMTIGDGRFSILRSLFIDNETRNPKVRGQNQFINNIVYNWVTAGYIMGDTTAESSANVEGNYMIEGPNDGGSAFASGTPQFHIYANNNYLDANKNGVLDGSLITSYPGADVVAGPHPFPKVFVESPQAALTRVISKVGPSLYRDEVDTRMIQEVSSYGTLGQIVVTEEGQYPGWPGALPSPPKPTDTDNDGIPDSWETSHGLNPNLSTDWKNIGVTGYTRLEEYVNELGSVHADRIWTASSGTWPTGASWTGGVPTFDDNAYIRGNGGATNGNVTISAAGAEAFRVFIGGNGSVTGETLTVSAGALTVQDSINVGYQNNASLIINNGGSVSTSAVLLGTTSFSGNLNIDNGTLITGVIAVLGGSGTVQLNNATIRANGWLNFTSNANIGSLGLVIDGNGSVGTISGNLSGPGGITARGNGTISLTGTNTYTGPTVLEGGSTGITADANIGGAAVPITFNGGMLRINGTTLTNINSHPVNWASFDGGFDVASSANTFTVSNNIGGSGSVTKGGAGMLVLSGTNTYTGGTAMLGGTLSVSSNANLGANGSPLTFGGGALRVTGNALLNLDNHPLAGGTVGGTLDIQSTSPFAINQVINGSGSLTKAGSGTLVLGAANAFSGDLFIKGGAVRLGDAWGIRYMTLNLDTAGTTFDVNGFNALIGGLAGNQNFDLKGKAPLVGKNNLDTTFSGTISDSVGGGTFIKMGTGTLTLTGNSTTTSAFSVTGGRINIPSLGNYGVAGPLGAGVDASSLILDGGQIRHYGAAATTNRLITLGVNGGTLNGAGTGGFAFTSTSPIAFTGAGDRTLFLEGSQTGNGFSFLLTDPVGGKLSLNKLGSGRWLLNGTQTHTYSGDTTVSAGTLLLFGGSNLLPSGAGKGNLVIASGAQFDMNGNNLSINGLNGAGNLNQRGSTSRTLTLGNGNASGNFSGTLTNVLLSTQGTLNISKTGTGTQILSGVNTYLGTTLVSGGVLQFNAITSIGGTGASVTVNAPGAAAAGYAMDQAFLARIAPASNGALLFAVNSANLLDLNTPGLSGVTMGALGSISYTGTLTPHATTGYSFGGGNGTLTLPNSNMLTGSRNLKAAAGTTLSISSTNDYLGSTTMLPGATIIAPALGNGGGVSSIGGSSSAASNLILDGGTLRGGGTTDRLFTLTANGGTLDGLTGITFNGIGAVAMSGSGDRTLNLIGTSTTNNFNLDFGDPATGKTSLVKSGTGRWFVGGNAKTYSGDTIVNGGTLHTNAAVLPNGIGKGNVIVNAGTLNLGNNTTSINGLSGAGIVDQGGTNTRSLNLGGNNANGTFSGTINASGVFSVNKDGNGTQVLSGALNFGANLSVNAGTLIVTKFPNAAINAFGGTMRQSSNVTLNDPADVSIVKSLNTTAGTIDLTNNGLVIDYATTTPSNTIRSMLASGNLMSSTAAGTLTIGYAEAADIGTTHFAGITTDTTALILETAIRGDTNLDRVVDSQDFNALSGGYGALSGGLWSGGDLNYDGKVNTLDFNELAGNFGLSLPAPAPVASSSLGAVVPEPGMISAISLISLLAVRRRRIG